MNEKNLKEHAQNIGLKELLETRMTETEDEQLKTQIKHILNKMEEESFIDENEEDKDEVIEEEEYEDDMNEEEEEDEEEDD